MSMRLNVIVLLALCAAIGAADTVPAPATLYPANGGEPVSALVQRVTLSTVFMLLDAGGGATAESQKNYRDFKRIEYARPEDVAYITAKLAYEKNDFAKAIESFRAAAKSAKWQPLREESLALAARCAINLKKWDDALALIGELEQTYAESIHLPEATSMRGDAAMGKGDAAAATAAYKKLVDSAKDWGPEASVLGVRGQAAVARAGGKPGDAAAIIAKSLGKSISVDAPGYGALALQLGDDLIAAGKKAEALAAYEGMTLAPIDGSEQAAAHLGAGKLIADTAATPDELGRAFDHACLAVVLRGADGKTSAGGRELARAVVAKMHAVAAKDAKFKELVDKEYQPYLNNL